MTAAVQTHELSKTFRGGVQALDGLNLEVAETTVFGLLGPNGAGKTTAVRILATLIRPTGGWARVGGHDVVREPALVRALIGLTGQYAAVDELIPGRENLYMIARINGLARRQARRQADQLLEAFGLTEAASKPVKSYSGGMRRRLDLAASLVTQPKVLFLDEPTTGLDPRSRGLLWEIIRDRAVRGTTVLLTTQYLEEADHLCDHVAVIDHGRVVAAGPPERLKAQVGGQRLEVRPVVAADLDAAARILAEVTGETPAAAAEGQLVSVPVTDPSKVSDVLRRLSTAGIEVGQLSIRGPSLDEVFLTLTSNRPPSQVGSAAQGGAG